MAMNLNPTLIQPFRVNAEGNCYGQEASHPTEQAFDLYSVKLQTHFIVGSICMQCKVQSFPVGGVLAKCSCRGASRKKSTITRVFAGFRPQTRNPDYGDPVARRLILEAITTEGAGSEIIWRPIRTGYFYDDNMTVSEHTHYPRSPGPYGYTPAGPSTERCPNVGDDPGSSIVPDAAENTSTRQGPPPYNPAGAPFPGTAPYPQPQAQQPQRTFAYGSSSQTMPGYPSSSSSMPPQAQQHSQAQQNPPYASGPPPQPQHSGSQYPNPGPQYSNPQPQHPGPQHPHPQPQPNNSGYFPQPAPPPTFHPPPLFKHQLFIPPPHPYLNHPILPPGVIATYHNAGPPPPRYPPAGQVFNYSSPPEAAPSPYCAPSIPQTPDIDSCVRASSPGVEDYSSAPSRQTNSQDPGGHDGLGREPPSRVFNKKGKGKGKPPCPQAEDDASPQLPESPQSPQSTISDPAQRNLGSPNPVKMGKAARKRKARAERKRKEREKAEEERRALQGGDNGEGMSSQAAGQRGNLGEARTTTEHEGRAGFDWSRWKTEDGEVVSQEEEDDGDDEEENGGASVGE
ncbi:hypothetical protein QBC34DRAFT_384247 [Podospora aff. communis PSN243]|uniref:Uncharacterized protein n=1 Tax=Podospora aff. communis PSN243 TaxID=3040156 RepID=A0AAV9GAJ0_9PEZI|nr:hypothetical protein QBC34DRAFT_384247 [Podospora aff. communis PSN243]